MVDALELVYYGNDSEVDEVDMDGKQLLLTIATAMRDEVQRTFALNDIAFDMSMVPGTEMCKIVVSMPPCQEGAESIAWTFMIGVAMINRADVGELSKACARIFSDAVAEWMKPRLVEVAKGACEAKKGKFWG